MKPFNLQEALAGKSVITRDGKAIKQVAFFPDAESYPVLAYSEGKEVDTYTAAGRRFFGTSPLSSGKDLFMGAPKVTKWVNLYRKSKYLQTSNADVAVGISTFDTEEEARRSGGENRVGTLQVEWEE
jgi:hypothetical protein